MYKMAVSVSIAVIIPTLNEATILPSTLAELAGCCGAASVIVVDGGSTDRTTQIAAQADALIIEGSPANRGVQLNRGAAQSDADVLLFLHADTQLNSVAFKNLMTALNEQPELAGGGFARVFDSPSLTLKLTCWISCWRSRTLGVFLGDQGIFVRRNVFEDLGGFSESMPIGEDLDFVLKLKEKGLKTICIDPPIRSSARRFNKRGPLLQTIIDLWLSFRIISSR